MGDTMKTASFSLAEAKFSMSGDFTQVVIQSVAKAQIKIRTKRDNVAGKLNRVLFSIETKNLSEFIFSYT